MMQQSPGECLTKMMEKRGISVAQISTDLSLSQTIIRSIAADKAKVSVEMSIRLAKYFGTPPEYWLKMQMTLDLAKAYQDKPLMQSIAKIAKFEKPAGKSGRKPAADKVAGKPGRKAAEAKPAGKPGRKPAGAKAAADKVAGKPGRKPAAAKAAEAKPAGRPGRKPAADKPAGAKPGRKPGRKPAEKNV